MDNPIVPKDITAIQCADAEAIVQTTSRIDEMTEQISDASSELANLNDSISTAYDAVLLYKKRVKVVKDNMSLLYKKLQ